MRQVRSKLTRRSARSSIKTCTASRGLSKWRKRYEKPEGIPLDGKRQATHRRFLEGGGSVIGGPRTRRSSAPKHAQQNARTSNRRLRRSWSSTSAACQGRKHLSPGRDLVIRGAASTGAPPLRAIPQPLHHAKVTATARADAAIPVMLESTCATRCIAGGQWQLGSLARKKTPIGEAVHSCTCLEPRNDGHGVIWVCGAAVPGPRLHRLFLFALFLFAPFLFFREQ